MKFTCLVPLLGYMAMASAQNLSFVKADPGPGFQDADAGAMAMADVDGDGDMDIMMTGKGGPVKSTLYLNDGSGNFSESTVSSFENVFGGWVAFSDVDGDLDLDLLVTGKTHGGITVANMYRNDGSGTYTLAAAPFTPSWGGEGAFGDVDGDGDPDVLLTGADQQDNPLAELYLNDGSGNFAVVPNTPFTPVGVGRVSFFDFDKDNDLDVLLTGETQDGSQVTKLYANDGSGTFAEVAEGILPGLAKGSMAVGDCDNDGDADILLSGLGDSGVSRTDLYLNEGDWVFALYAGTPFPGTIAGKTVLADLDVDGDLDVLVNGASAAGIVSLVFENVGGHVFLPADSLDGMYLTSMAVGDIDGDSDPDIVLGGTSFIPPTRGTRTFLNTTSPVMTEESFASGGVVLHPNPNHGGFTLTQRGQGPASAEIFDMAGRLVQKMEWQGESREVRLAVPPGTYIIRTEADGKIGVEKFVVR